MNNTHISLAEFASRAEARIISGIMVFAIFASQALYPYSALAVYDIKPAIATNPTYSNLVQANTTASTSLGTLLTAANTLTTMNTQLNTAQNSVLTLAMNQGLQGVSLTQITDASKILPDDALKLAGVMVNEGVLAGTLNTTQLKAGMTLSMESAENMILTALRASSGSTLMYNGISYLVGNVDDSLNDVTTCQGDVMNDNVICTLGYDGITALIDNAINKITAYPNAITVQSGKELLSTYVFGMDPNAQAVCNLDGCNPPPIPAFMYDASMDGVVSSAIKSTIVEGLAGELVSATGLLDQAAYKELFAEKMIEFTGLGNLAALANSLTLPSFTQFQVTVTNAIHAEILNQVSMLSESLIGSASINNVIEGLIGNPKKAISDIANQLINEALGTNALSLTQLTSLKSIDRADVENILNGVLADTGLNVSSLQLNQILNGSLAQFGSFAGVADIADIKGIIGGQIAGIVPGLNVNTLISQMSAGTLSGIQDTITGAIQDNVVSQLAALGGGANLAQIQSTLASSILGATGAGDLAGISGLVSGLSAGSLTSLTANVPVLSLATQSVQNAISGGVVSLTQLSSLGTLGIPDVQNILNGALKDTGLLNAISADQFNTILSGSLEGFISFDKNIAGVADIEKILSTQIAKVVPGLDVNTLMGQMGAGTLTGFQDTIANVMEGNVMAQLSSLTGTLDVAQVQSILSNSILGTTGVGDLAGISNVIGNLPNLAGSLGNIEGTIQGVMEGQLGQLSTVLSAGNLEGLISGQLSDLSGLASLSDVTSIMGAINPNISQAFSSITQVGGQLTSITGQFEGALGGLTLGLNSLTSSFNGQLGSLTNLTQLNLVGLSGDVSGIVGGLAGQITGPLSGAVGSLSGIAGGITGTGLASVADLGGLAGSLGTLSGGLGGVLGGAGGIASLAGMGGMTTVSGMMQMPFGGRIVRSIPCTCTPGFPFLVTLDANYAGGPNTFIFFPGRSVLFANYQIYRRGPYTIGLYSAVPMGCAIYVLIGCSGMGGGPIITMVGTSR